MTLSDWEKRYNKSLIEFLGRTATFLNKAINRPANERSHIQNAWKHHLGIHANDCRDIILQILHELSACKENKNNLEKKCSTTSCIWIGGQLVIITGGIAYFWAYGEEFNGNDHLIYAGIGIGVSGFWNSLLYFVYYPMSRKLKSNQQRIKDVQWYIIKCFPMMMNGSQEFSINQPENIPDSAFDRLKISDVSSWSNDELLRALRKTATQRLESLRLNQ